MRHTLGQFSAILSIGAFLLLVMPASAQLPQPIDITVLPEQPEPFKPVQLEVNSSQIDIDRSTFIWFINGKEKARGVGENKAFFIAGPSGSATSIRVVVETTQGATLARSVTVRPAEVDILWEGFSYTPPFYKGKSYSPSGGLVVLTAMPNIVDQNGNVVQPKDLVFTWKNLGITLGGSSGLGKNQIVLTNEVLAQESLTVTVEVATFSGNISAQKAITIPVRQQRVLLYEKHPLEGIRYEKAITSSDVFGQEEITLRAEPYFFSLDDYVNGNLSYRWEIDNRDVSIPLDEQTNEIVLRLEERRSGQADILIKVQNNNLPLRIFQEAQTQLRLNLNQ